MSIFPSILGPLSQVIDRVIPDPKARDEAKIELTRLETTNSLDQIRVQLSAILADTNSGDPWTMRARPCFLYMMYVIILFSLPVGIVAAFNMDRAKAIAIGIGMYLNGLPEPLYALFGTGYVGYTVARQWGKVAKTDR